MQRAQLAADAKQSMLGFSKEQILQCMGPANNIQAIGNTESWQYYSGRKSFVHSNINIYDNNYATVNSNVTTRYCVVNVTFLNNKLSSITYSGKTGGLFSHDSECAYAVRNCTTKN